MTARLMARAVMRFHDRLYQARPSQYFNGSMAIGVHAAERVERFDTFGGIDRHRVLPKYSVKVLGKTRECLS